MGFARPAVAVVVVVIGALAAAPVAAGRLDGAIAYGVLDADGSVYTVHPDGTGSRKVLRHAQWVEFSRDARQLAFARDYGDKGLWTADADGTDRRRVVDPARREVEGQLDYQTWDPAWSPDGKRIAFAALWEVQRGEDAREEWRVVSVGATGGALRVLADGSDPAWSPTGDLIAYTTDVGGTVSDRWNRVAIIRSNGEGRRFVVRGRTAWRTGLDFSPNGRKLLYRELDFSREHARLRVLDLRTGRRTTVTTQPVEAAAWSPSGRWIAYLHNVPTPEGQRVPPTEVRIIRPNGTGNRLLFSLPFEERTGRWADALSWRAHR